MTWIKTVDRIRRMDEITEERIRVAVLAERERCAGIADSYMTEECECHAAEIIAVVIREEPEDG